jgi:hypothetical protein
MTVQPQIAYSASATTSATNTTSSFSSLEGVLDPSFPSRHPNIVGSLYGRKEVALVDDGTTGGTKPTLRRIVLFEDAEGLPGVLNYLWNALGSNTLGEILQGAGEGAPIDSGFRYHFYFDDRTRETFSIDLVDFFVWNLNARAYETPRVGISKLTLVDQFPVPNNGNLGYDGFGAYRYFFAPYKGYCRVEFSNSNSTGHSIWAQVGGHRLTEPYDGPRKTWLFARNTATVSAYDTLTTSVENSGFTRSFASPLKGQIECVSARLRDITSGPFWQEGDVALFSGKNVLIPEVRSTGMEDWSNSAFGAAAYTSTEPEIPQARNFDVGTYVAATHTHSFADPTTGDWSTSSAPSGPTNAHTHTVTVRGVTYTTAPADGTGVHDHFLPSPGYLAVKTSAFPGGAHTGQGICHYRWLQNDPFFFEDDFKAQWYASQRGQSDTNVGSANASVAVSAWVDQSVPPKTFILPDPDTAGLEARKIHHQDFRGATSLNPVFGRSWSGSSTLGSGVLTQSGFTANGLRIVRPNDAEVGLWFEAPTHEIDSSRRLVHRNGAGGNTQNTVLFYTTDVAIDQSKSTAGAQDAMAWMSVHTRGGVLWNDGTGGNGINIVLPYSQSGNPNQHFVDTINYRGFIESRYRNNVTATDLIGRDFNAFGVGNEITLGCAVDRTNDYFNGSFGGASQDYFFWYYKLKGDTHWTALSITNTQLAYGAGSNVNARHVGLGVRFASATFTNFSVYALPRITEFQR